MHIKLMKNSVINLKSTHQTHCRCILLFPFHLIEAVAKYGKGEIEEKERAEKDEENKHRWDDKPTGGIHLLIHNLNPTLKRNALKRGEEALHNAVEPRDAPLQICNVRPRLHEELISKANDDYVLYIYLK